MSPMVVQSISMGLLGLIVGSFLAAVSVRLPRDEDIVLAPSRCMRCERTLAPWHLVPVLSWLALRGRCGWCSAPISLRYPLVELAACGVGVWAAIHGGGWPMVGATAMLGWMLLLIAIVDAECFWLPDVLTWPLAVVGLAFAAWSARGVPWNALIGVAAGFGSLWLLAFTYRALRKRDGLGGGDPFLFGAAGAWVGWMGLPSVLLWACAVGFALVLSRMVLRKSVSGSDRLPLGTFLAIGVWLTWLWGPLGLYP